MQTTKKWTIKPEFNWRSVADSAVLSQGLKGKYKRPLTSRDFIGL